MENSENLELGSNSLSGTSKNISGPNSVRGVGSLQQTPLSQQPSYLTGSRRVNTPKQGLQQGNIVNNILNNSTAHNNNSRDFQKITIPSATNNYTNNSNLVSGSGIMSGNSTTTNQQSMHQGNSISGGGSNSSANRGISPQILLGQLRDNSNSRQ